MSVCRNTDIARECVALCFRQLSIFVANYEANDNISADVYRRAGPFATVDIFSDELSFDSENKP